MGRQGRCQGRSSLPLTHKKWDALRQGAAFRVWANSQVYLAAAPHCHWRAPAWRRTALSAPCRSVNGDDDDACRVRGRAGSAGRGSTPLTPLPLGPAGRDTARRGGRERRAVRTHTHLRRRKRRAHAGNAAAGLVVRRPARPAGQVVAEFGGGADPSDGGQLQQPAVRGCVAGGRQRWRWPVVWSCWRRYAYRTTNNTCRPVGPLCTTHRMPAPGVHIDSRGPLLPTLLHAGRPALGRRRGAAGWSLCRRQVAGAAAGCGNSNRRRAGDADELQVRGEQAWAWVALALARRRAA